MLDSPSAPETSDLLRRAFRALVQAGLFGLLLLACVIPAQPGRADSDSGLPLPRYASFKSNEVNLRAGAGETYPIQWVYQRAGMPVEIFDQVDNWRRIRDYQGVVGWVSVNLLSSAKRTAIVIETRRTLHETASETSPPVAYLDPSVIGRLLECGGDWCRLEVKDNEGRDHEGWLKRSEIWGVTPTEAFKE
jgi:SH3-like domain-containing protein